MDLLFVLYYSFCLFFQLRIVFLNLFILPGIVLLSFHAVCIITHSVPLHMLSYRLIVALEIILLKRATITNIPVFIFLLSSGIIMFLINTIQFRIVD